MGITRIAKSNPVSVVIRNLGRLLGRAASVRWFRHREARWIGAEYREGMKGVRGGGGEGKGGGERKGVVNVNENFNSVDPLFPSSSFSSFSLIVVVFFRFVVFSISFQCAFILPLPFLLFFSPPPFSSRMWRWICQFCRE